MSTDNDDELTGEHWVDVLSSVKITVTNPEAISRCTENTEDERGDGTMVAWRDQYYKLETVEDVMRLDEQVVLHGHDADVKVSPPVEPSGVGDAVYETVIRPVFEGVEPV